MAQVICRPKAPAPSLETSGNRCLVTYRTNRCLQSSTHLHSPTLSPYHCLLLLLFPSPDCLWTLGISWSLLQNYYLSRDSLPSFGWIWAIDSALTDCPSNSVSSFLHFPGTSWVFSPTDRKISYLWDCSKLILVWLFFFFFYVIDKRTHFRYSLSFCLKHPTPAHSVFSWFSDPQPHIEGYMPVTTDKKKEIW